MLLGAVLPWHTAFLVLSLHIGAGFLGSWGNFQGPGVVHGVAQVLPSQMASKTGDLRWRLYFDFCSSWVWISKAEVLVLVLVSIKAIINSLRKILKIQK